MLTDRTLITPEIARHVLWHFGEPGGYRPGSFTESLMTTIATADVSNAARCALGFPEYTAAVLLAKNNEQGVTELWKIAGVTP